MSQIKSRDNHIAVPSFIPLGAPASILSAKTGSMSEWMLRHFRQGDETHLPAIFRAAVTELGCRDYSAAQVAVWAGLAPAPMAMFTASGTSSTVAPTLDMTSVKKVASVASAAWITQIGTSPRALRV